eukprot:PhM_4_TR9559/c0_g1_i3/m.15552
MDMEYRPRRKHSVRQWTQEMESLLLHLAEKVPLEGGDELSGQRRSHRILQLWEEHGHYGFSDAELAQKLSALERIQTMLLEESTVKMTDEVSPLATIMHDMAHYDYLVRAVQDNDVEKIRALDEDDPRTTHATDPSGRIILHVAAEAGSLDIVRVLVARGANVNRKDKEGNVPLFCALRRGNTDVVAYLLDAGADPTVVNQQGNSALHLACHANLEYAVRRLVRAGANVNLQNNLQQTPLHVASHRSSRVICDLLVVNGADPTVRDIRGNVPASLARRMSKTLNESSLVVAGCDEDSNNTSMKVEDEDIKI